MNGLNDMDELQEFLDNLPDFEVSDRGFSADLIVAYMAISENLNSTELEDNQYLVSQIENATDENIKVALVKLSFGGNVESYRALESVVENLKEELKEFGSLCLMFARFRLESDLTDSDKGILLTGLGGDAGHFRYYVGLFCEGGAFSKDQIRLVEQTFQEDAERKDSKVESFESCPSYILTLVLGSIHYSINDLLEDLLDQLPFVRRDYMVTNVEKPTHEKLEYLNSLTEEEFGEISNSNEGQLPPELLETMERLGIKMFDMEDDLDSDLISFEDDDDDYDDYDDEEDELDEMFVGDDDSDATSGSKVTPSTSQPGEDGENDWETEYFEDIDPDDAPYDDDEEYDDDDDDDLDDDALENVEIDPDSGSHSVDDDDSDPPGDSKV